MKKYLMLIVFFSLLITGTFLASCEQDVVEPVPEVTIPMPGLPEDTQHHSKERGITIK